MVGPAGPADLRKPRGPESPGMVAFETGTVAGQVADTRDEPGLHDAVINSTHESRS